jgi:tRNA G18 (ribose-2'-O)-methylase SpoU
MPITDPEDPRIADYRHLKERDLSAAGDRFVAESERVVRRLFASDVRVHSLLVTPPRLAAMADLLAHVDPPRCPVYVASQAVIDGIAGFHVHRGCLAIGERPARTELPAGARLVVAVEDLVDTDNLGAIVRNAAAFGADGLLLSPRCADPFYRKAIRVSLGSVFLLPIIRLRRWPDDLIALRATQGFSAVAAVLTPTARPLASLAPPERTILLLGSEGPGLSPAAIAACDHQVTIPMSAGADSLNVATAAAVFLYHLGGSAAQSTNSLRPVG